jgi:hypothetical protein
VPPDLDADIDRLYQLPFSEFTDARNKLASGAGARAAEIKALQKPNAAAWAVNQLYWGQRKLFDKLVTATERLRAAHAKKLSGQNADLPQVQAQHRAVLDAAVGAARKILEEAGDAATPATLTAVTETLDAWPWSEPPGRLTRPLKPGGFEVLAGLLSGAPPAPAKRAEVVKFDRGAGGRGARDADKQAREKALAKEAAVARAKEARDLEKQIAAAERAEREAEAALSTAKKSLERAGRDRAKLETELQAAIEQVDELTTDVKRLQHRADASSVERKRLQDQLARVNE